MRDIDLTDPLVRKTILNALGEIAQAKYDELVSYNHYGYNLLKLKGSLKYKSNIELFHNEYYLEGVNDEWTRIAKYFEYGTGLYNTKRSGRYRAGYIKPTKAHKYLAFMGTKKFAGQLILAKRVKGVRPVFAMLNTLAFMRKRKNELQLKIIQVIRDRRRRYVYYDDEPKEGNNDRGIYNRQRKRVSRLFKK